MLHREESRHDFAFIAGVIIGAIAGAVATLALTPMSGNETREMIRSRVNELEMDDLKERASQVKGMAAERASNVANQAQPMMDKVKTQVAKSPLPVGNDEKDQESENVTEMKPTPAADRPTSS